MFGLAPHYPTSTPGLMEPAGYPPIGGGLKELLAS